MAVDLEQEQWKQQTDGTLLKIHEPQQSYAGVPVEVVLRWARGGWNEIVDVRIGSEVTNLVHPAFNKNGLATTSFFQGDDLPDPAMSFVAIHPDVLQRLATIAYKVQQDIETTRAAVQFVRDNGTLADIARIQEQSLKKSHVGTVARKTNKVSDNKQDKVSDWLTAYNLKALLEQQGFEKFVQLTADLLGIGVSTVHSHCKKAEQHLAAQAPTKPKAPTKKPASKTKQNSTTTKTTKRGQK
jgi:hypothetical protein